MLRDCAGLPVTCASHEALQALNEMLMAGLSFRESPLPLARRALELDPGLVLAHCMLVGLTCYPSFTTSSVLLIPFARFPGVLEPVQLSPTN